MKVIELFCGTKSISKQFEARGHKCFTVDVEKCFSPSLCKDILSLNLEDIPRYFINSDVVWASPPCTTFSVASMGHHWTGGKGAYIPKTKEAEIGLQLMNKTVSLIHSLSPKIWFIENPRGLMRKLIRFPQDMSFYHHTVTYCQYGDKRMKPTDIWTNCAAWIPKPICKNGASCHEAAPRGSKTGTQGLKNAKERSKIPKALCMEIVESSEKYIC